MVEYPIGELIAGRVRSMGVTPFYKMFKHDGVRGPNMATVYSDRGFGVRGPVVFYNRCNEAAAQLKPGDFDWDDDLRRRRALVPQRRHLRVALRDDLGADHRRHAGGAQARRRRLARPELPREALGRGRRRRPRRRDARPHRRARRRAGRQRRGSAEGPRHRRPGGDQQGGVGARSERVLRHDRSRRASDSRSIKVVATTLRHVHSTNRHSWSAVAWINGQTHVAPTCELDVYDRVGGGDGFASGLFYGLLSGEPPEECVKLGWAHGAMITAFPGDTTMATLEQVRAFAKGGSARIQR